MSADLGGIILAGGRGKRMGQLSDRWPKPLLPVLNSPIMTWSLTAMRDVGVTATKAPSGPVGGLLACMRRSPSGKHLLVAHGDVFVADGFAGLAEAHRVNGADVTMLVTAVGDPSRFGTTRVVRGVLRGWAEKSPDSPPGSLVNAGVYLFGRSACQMCLRFPLAPESDFKDLLPWLARSGLSVRVHRTNRLWSDVGTQASLRSLNTALLGDLSWRERAASLCWDRSRYDSRLNWMAVTAKVGRCDVSRSVIGAGAVIADGCQLVECVVLPHAIVQSNTIARRALIS